MKNFSSQLAKDIFLVFILIISWRNIQSSLMNNYLCIWLTMYIFCSSEGLKGFLEFFQSVEKLHAKNFWWYLESIWKLIFCLIWYFKSFWIVVPCLHKPSSRSFYWGHLEGQLVWALFSWSPEGQQTFLLQKLRTNLGSQMHIHDTPFSWTICVSYLISFFLIRRVAVLLVWSRVGQVPSSAGSTAELMSSRGCCVLETYPVSEAGWLFGSLWSLEVLRDINEHNWKVGASTVKGLTK